MAYLTIEYPNGREARIMLLAPAVLIGRSPEADIQVEADWVSGKHARLIREPQGYSIEDLGSSNGTFINYERVSKRLLVDNDLIFLGRTKVLYRHGSAELEESSVELDVLDDEHSGIFTPAPPPTELPRLQGEVPPSADEVAEILRNNETNERISIAAFNKTHPEQTQDELKTGLKEAHLQVASLQVELDSQRKRAEQEINRLLKELNTWKSRYFDKVEECNRLRRQDGEASTTPEAKG